MARSGPLTRDSSAVLAGLAQIRVGNAMDCISYKTPVLNDLNSIGALASTKFSSSVDYLKLESGFPALEDLSIPTRSTALVEAAFKEISPFTMAMAKGADPFGKVGTITGATGGAVALGASAADIAATAAANIMCAPGTIAETITLTSVGSGATATVATTVSTSADVKCISRTIAGVTSGVANGFIIKKVTTSVTSSGTGVAATGTNSANLTFGSATTSETIAITMSSSTELTSAIGTVGGTYTITGNKTNGVTLTRDGDIVAIIATAFFGGTTTAADVYSLVVTSSTLLTIASSAFVNGTFVTGHTLAIPITKDAAHSGSIGLGDLTSPVFLRVEVVFTYPNGKILTAIFPRCNVTSSVELDGQAEDFASSPVKFEAKRADDAIAGGLSLWNVNPLGRLHFS